MSALTSYFSCHQIEVTKCILQLSQSPSADSEPSILLASFSEPHFGHFAINLRAKFIPSGSSAMKLLKFLLLRAKRDSKGRMRMNVQKS